MTFSQVSAFADGCVEVRPGERQPAGLEPVVVAGDAVLVERSRQALASARPAAAGPSAACSRTIASGRRVTTAFGAILHQHANGPLIRQRRSSSPRATRASRRHASSSTPSKRGDASGRPRAARAEAPSTRQRAGRRRLDGAPLGRRSATTSALVDLLLAAGANVKAATRYNITPLSLACTNGNARIVDRLLKAGADPNGTSEEGQTALMTASLTGKPDAVQAAARDRRERQRGRAVQGPDRADVGGVRRQRRRGRDSASRTAPT